MAMAGEDEVKQSPEVFLDAEKQTPVVWDTEAEKKLRWKCDLHVLPCISHLFALAFLDRTNIGNAKIQGMVQDLNMTGHDYNIALFAFFVPYILFEVPSNIIIKRIAPSTWLSIIMVLWGIATVGQGLVDTVGGLIACRFLLGLFEAGVFPGCVYLISMYYTRFELQWRLSLFFSASIVSSAVSGLLAYAIADMKGVGGYNAWRWIFIIEGLFTVVVGALSKFFTADWPETASFLNDEERAILVARLAKDHGAARMDHLDKQACKRAFSDWKIYCSILQYLGIVNTGYSGSFFVPTIIEELGYEAQQAQARSVPIFLVAAVLCLITAYLTDRLQHRYAFTMLGVLVATVGYVLLLCQQHISVGVQYFALFLIVGGGFTTQPVTLAWLSNNVSGHYKRAIASAMQVGFGNCGGIVASNIFVQAEQPLYRTGYGTSLGLVWLCGIACTVMFFGVLHENRKRHRGDRDWRLEEADVDNMGDDHPSWRFST
ncbi:putative MFS transporter [Cryphonectria parasitica EP155]|uniref:MFS transporter n=1 Tax=Cryphonectria parasitica (strain ATCC 38755 / EP155) TaxID=660469 RepID=A0A9P5CII5_CRYP1|nr:putative MFS transporter [Cryphonectria parasitica EP155]KAF3760744.1 putative MFS transporter [Cryphonectria parasitica EP155]